MCHPIRFVIEAQLFQVLPLPVDPPVYQYIFIVFFIIFFPGVCFLYCSIPSL